MAIRRCAVAWLEPREVANFQLDDLLSGGTGIVSRLAWFAHAPHLPEAIEIDAALVPLVGALGPLDWIERGDLEARFGAEAVEAMLANGVWVSNAADDPLAAADEALRTQGWYPATAVAHMASRWEGVDGPKGMAEQDLDSNEGILRNHGMPPSHALPSATTAADVALPAIARDDFDALLDTRTTCRNYDLDAVLPLATFSQLLARVFGARGIGRPAPGFEVFKRTSPSGGSLHPTECYLIVQRVDGIAPGLYRYRIDGHALEAVMPGVAPPQPGDAGTCARGDAAPRAWSADELRAFARIAVAGQDFFADAAVLCVLAPRFHRNFWKYRNHAKAYRVCVLDVGHLSQTLQLCATQAGLGPFVTGAINEVDLERAFGMAGYAQSPLVVCGFGKRAATLVKSEFDPNRRAWPRG
ncbi:putative peptide maturation dehydrogenase [Thermomonas mangrovi]|uniref:putative peptide maturation dehydrogenase n=1 Tax=Thermomonas mangrovi TaxID=2993316 RepID=UPI002307F18E|nr:putative peptide maturation dehydrogenase [Thermomonas mangrovi]